MTDEARWDEANKLWDAFLIKFPAGKIESMTLAEYTALIAESETGSFTYWLEHKLMSLGSIRGGSSVKFGVWRTDKESKQPNTQNDGRYAWHGDYGASSQEAFDTIKQRIKETIEAVQRADLSKVASIVLPDSLKWKIAFMYQDRAQPCVLNVFTPDALRLYLGAADKKKSVAELQKEVMAKRENKELFTFGHEIWRAWSEDVIRHFKFKNKVHRDFNNAAKAWNKEQKLFFIEVVTSFNRLGFDWYFIEPKTSTAYTLRVARKKEPSKTFTVLGYFNFKKIVFIREHKSTKGTEEEHHFGADRQADFSLWFDKNFGHEVEMEGSNKKGNWPDAYDEAEEVNDVGETNAANEKGINMNTEMPLNQILYGPPGTGKTYAMIDKALEIIEPTFLEQYSKNRTELKKRFDALVAEGRIKFTTFHQSFSYEDFVEGIRADAGGDDEAATGLTYRVESGVFKRICDAARASTLEVESFGVNEKPKVWKISIESAGDSEVKEYCFKNGEARIGWGDKGELTIDKLTELSGKIGTNEHSTLRDFAQNMQIGDILLCISSVTEVGRVGIVESDYVFEEDVPTGMREDYCNVRKVKWLPFSEKFSILPLNESKRFTLKTVYELWRITWEDIVQVIQRDNLALAKKEAKPYVLVIDEINRGNISKIFGELITLIESSKREGADEALSVVLPYSKKLFSVPDNVYIIGTMNSADRSLAALDLALRRRFDFIEMPPDANTLAGIVFDGIEVQQMFEVINQRIEVLLGRDYCIGHAYFFPLENNPSLGLLANIFKNKIIPLLQEYFFEDWARIAQVLNSHPVNGFVVKQSFSENLFGSNAKPEAMLNTEVWRIKDKAFKVAENYRAIYEPTNQKSDGDDASKVESS